MSLKCSERFLQSLPPGQNCGNDKSLLPMYEILESGICYFPGTTVKPFWYYFIDYGCTQFGHPN